MTILLWSCKCKWHRRYPAPRTSKHEAVAIQHKFHQVVPALQRQLQHLAVLGNRCVPHQADGIPWQIHSQGPFSPGSTTFSLCLCFELNSSCTSLLFHTMGPQWMQQICRTIQFLSPLHSVALVDKYPKVPWRHSFVHREQLIAAIISWVHATRVDSVDNAMIAVKFSLRVWRSLQSFETSIVLTWVTSENAGSVASSLKSTHSYSSALPRNVKLLPRLVSVQPWGWMVWYGFHGLLLPTWSSFVKRYKWHAWLGWSDLYDFHRS